ncbi:MAG: riboflavin biosynthesis protein RibD, partial [Acidobacteria bacterium]
QESRAAVHELRHRSDALITGSGTVIADNPQLTDRSGRPRRRPLLRVILDRRGRVSSSSDGLIFRGELSALAAELYSREIQSFLLECGPDLAFNAIRAGIIDKIVAFVAPKIMGGREIPAIGGEGIEKLSEAIPLKNFIVTRSGPDVVLTAYVHRDR